MDDLSQEFLIDSTITYLNHGSYGACPREVFWTYQSLQRQMESQPVAFLGRQVQERMQEARRELGEYLGVCGDDLVYFTNPTTAVNMIVRNLKLEAGDEILATNHEYGALNRTWRYFTRLTGAAYINQNFSLPVTSPDRLIDEFFEGVTARTKVIFISHITSPTALILPVREICQRASAAGILTIVDGAHAPGQLELDLAELGADIYVGALHKWLCAPKGSAFAYITPRLQASFDPLVISWGYESEHPSESIFIDYHEWQGTRDMSAFLAVPAAIEFQKKHNWPERRREAHKLASLALSRLADLGGFHGLSGSTSKPESDYQWYCQMVAVQIPECDTRQVQRVLYERHRIEVPVYLWEDRPLLRMSFQTYNNIGDLDRLVDAIFELDKSGYFKR